MRAAGRDRSEFYFCKGTQTYIVLLLDLTASQLAAKVLWATLSIDLLLVVLLLGRQGIYLHIGIGLALPVLGGGTHVPVKKWKGASEAAIRIRVLRGCEREK